MTNHGKLFEDRLEQALIVLNLPYTREGSKRNYGVRGSNKGRFDFWVNNKIAIECKSIDRASDLRLPWYGLKNTAIKSHQLRALRNEYEKGNIAGLLIEVRSVGKMYWLSMKQLDAIVQELGMIAALHLDILDKDAYLVRDLQIFLEALNELDTSKNPRKR